MPHSEVEISYADIFFREVLLYRTEEYIDFIHDVMVLTLICYTFF
jgi:hypothetical protein